MASSLFLAASEAESGKSASALGLFDLVVLGDPDAVTARATRLGPGLSQARLSDPQDPQLQERLATEHARRRAHSRAHEEGMVHLGLADGMVSGAEVTGASGSGVDVEGLRKPVNDLSRGATVQDIVATVAITAVQAQGTQAAS